MLVRILLASALGLAPAVAERAGAQQGDRALVLLVVNEVAQGEVLVIREPADVLMRPADLEQAGVRGLTGRQYTIEGEPFLSLASLAPEVRYDLDEREVVLRLTVRPSRLAGTVLDLVPGPPPDIAYRQDTSAFFNYAVTAPGVGRYAAFGEAGLSLRGSLLFSGVSLDADGEVVRGLTSLTVDRPRDLVRWILGDSFAAGGELGGTVLMGGVTVTREFGLDPYFSRAPAHGLTGSVTTPSTAEVYVNDRLVRRERLAPGPFELRNLPLEAGRGVARVVIRDAFGREQEIASPYYVTSGLLAPGLEAFAYTLGVRRERQGTASADYGRPGFLGRHRIGLRDWLTLGGRLEADPAVVSGGPGLTLGLPTGELELTAALSGDDDGQVGGAASVGYRYHGRRFGLGAAVRTLTDRYATLTLRPADDRPRLETTAFVGVPVGRRASVTLQHTHATLRDGGGADRASVLTTVRLTDRLSLFANLSHSRADGGSITEGFAGLNVFLGRLGTAGLFHRQGTGGGGSAVEVHRSLPVGTGVGYRVRLEHDDLEDRGSARVQYQGPYGTYEAGYDSAGGPRLPVLHTAGAVVVIDGTVAATRPVRDGFGLIRVPGLAGVRGYLENQEIGRTNARGELVVPDLLPYYGNRVSIGEREIPFDYTIGATHRTVAPPYRGGAVITFPVRRVQGAAGTVVLEIRGRTVAPAYGRLVVSAEGREHESPLGRDGEFYLEDVPPGRHPARVEHREATCPFTLEIPPTEASVVTLGTLPCTVREEI